MGCLYHVEAFDVQEAQCLTFDLLLATWWDKNVV
jgi:hypothetical protein